MMISSKRPYARWIEDYRITLQQITEAVQQSGRLQQYQLDGLPLSEDKRMLAFCFSLEQLNMIVTPMLIFFC
jgi:glutamate synthase (NADPH/NADH)